MELSGPAATTVKRPGLTKVPTGIRGMDEILHGGLPENRTTVVVGSPGTGKSIFCLQFLCEGASNGIPGLLVSCEQSVEALRADAASIGLDLPALEEKGVLTLLSAEFPADSEVIGDFRFDPLLQRIFSVIERRGVRRIAIDELDLLLRLYEDPAAARRELYRIQRALRAREATLVLTAKTFHWSPGASWSPLLHFMAETADCLLELSQRVEAQITTRRLRVLKYRGSAFIPNECPFVITENGLIVIPVAIAGLGQGPMARKITSGYRWLDALLGGGFSVGAEVLIAGEPGTGKTTLAATFAKAACDRGEKVLYLSFEEPEHSLLRNLRRVGVDLRPAVEAGKLLFRAVVPESVGVEQHLAETVALTAQFQPKHIVVDAVSAFLRMGSSQGAHDYLIRLGNICRQRRITAIFLSELTGELGERSLSIAYLSSIADTVLVCRYEHDERGYRRVLRVLRSRGSAHSTASQEYEITGKGLSPVGSDGSKFSAAAAH